MFVLGIDPGLTTTGYGIIARRRPLEAITAGVIRTDRTLPNAARLRDLYANLTALLTEFRPHVVAIEQIFTNHNLQTAVSVGRASGVALLAAAEAGLQVFEYTPTTVKLAVTGDGGAGKKAIQAMLAERLRLASPPRPADAADALAVALCHLHSARLVVAS
jgi:crossover junction endodeoxyribonuclease RuvC